MIAIMWQFEVKEGHESTFEEFYGVDGEWSAVNRHSRSYLGTSFLRDQNLPSRYLLIEYWSEMVVYEQHKAYRSEDRTALDAKRNGLVTSVEPLGVFTALDVPDRAGPAWSWRGEK
jgi:heme-degrading monooxygenase HmoA